MPCPHCKQSSTTVADHRWCIVELFKTNVIQSVAQWEALSKPKTIVKGRIRALVPKE